MLQLHLHGSAGSSTSDLQRVRKNNNVEKLLPEMDGWGTRNRLPAKTPKWKVLKI